MSTDAKEKSKGNNNKNEKSMLEDASTLLMFSNFSKPSEEEPSNIENTGVSPESDPAAPLKRANSEDQDSDLLKDEKRQKLQSNSNNNSSKWPVSDDYIVDPDSGIITCICGFDDDDGFSIQCDHCNRWQHAICYSIEDMDNVPEDYLCNTCQPRNLDTKRARKLQLNRIKKQSVLLGINQAPIVAPTPTETNDTGNSTNHNTRSKSENNKGNDTVSATEPESKKPEPDTNVNSNNNNNNTSSNSTIDNNTNNNATKKKQEVFYLSAKSSYKAMYLPLHENTYYDKYIPLFMEKHENDDFIKTVSSSSHIKGLPIEVKSYSDATYARIFPGFTKLGVYLRKSCEKGTFIHEVLGDVNFKSQYVLDSRNHYRIWGTSKPKVFFHPEWPLYIDSRLSGNTTRYIRRSCNPNVKLSTVKVVQNGKSKIKFVLRATRAIDEGDEIHLPWMWDKKNIIWKIIGDDASVVFDTLNDSEKYLLINSVDTILRSCDCACGNNNKDCYLLKVKKYSQSMFRSVKSKMNNRYKLNEILNQYQGKRRRQPHILIRLAHEIYDNQERATEMISDYNSQKLKFLESKEMGKEKPDPRSEEKSKLPNKTPNNEFSRKPYKWKLLSKEVTNSVRNQSDVEIIERPSEYNELSISDLDKLPVIIDVNIDEVANNSLVPAGNNPKTPQESEGIFRDPETKEQIVTQTIISSPSSQSRNSISINPTTIAEDIKTGRDSVDSLKPLKKKLSFADYRKKQIK
ncbi:hypothetical protein Kpol_1016p13 [Vanderwaltozyma polyspora DSM 70294]|uniref:SET domain-containing protein n=1 Tax=Vanderwaltozyma polyspora (strain ATCC 22028 / DSM 70294 / BCRC 21397 / CBS 2163 / NBRC 10782 / NRRL Y-8283 / UCD 57-17) TaxID=436907 RepID=A7TNT0_VANPO|nr:uncharacterized protein Kpol_1016p13 [Vanderwaltozyma polyspora DSM 70294]EDO16073.1 hypothetical protein Kpol_1016p13 [Vanderwaltozyma polyspora DSM 70294]